MNDKNEVTITGAGSVCLFLAFTKGSWEDLLNESIKKKRWDLVSEILQFRFRENMFKLDLKFFGNVFIK